MSGKWSLVGLVGLALVFAGGVTSGQEWQTVYQTDFSADPGWTTNNPERHYWSSEDGGTYFFTQVNINNGGEWAYYEAGYDGGSFRLEGDIKVLSNEYASDVLFGIYDTDLNAYHNGSYVQFGFSLSDPGLIVYLQTHNSKLSLV